MRKKIQIGLLCLPALGLFLGLSTPVFGQCPCPPPCVSEDGTEQPGDPSDLTTTPYGAAAAAAGSDLFSTPGERVADAPATYAPNMIGDSMTFATTSIAAGDRRNKIAENNSPLPRNRFFFSYNHFHNAVSGDSDDRTHLDRFTFGAESTILDGLISLDFRIPFAAGLDRDQIAGSTVEGTEFGNLSLALKGLLQVDNDLALSAGLGMVFPTASDAGLVGLGGAPLREVDNETVFLQPFIGGLWTPNNVWFVQSFLQWDFAAGGNTVTTAAGTGEFQDQNLMYMDAQIGCWLYENPCARYIVAVAPVVELHYTTTMNDADSVLGVGHRFNRLDYLNITGGFHIQLPRNSMLTIAGVAPLRQGFEGEDAPFDSEIIFQLNRWF